MHYCVEFPVLKNPKSMGVPIHAMNTYSGSGGIAHSFLMELCNEWLAPQPGHFIPGERAPGMYCIEVALDPGLVWTFWRGEKSCASARSRDLDHLVHHLVTVKMTLSWLSLTDDMHSKCLLISFLLFFINLLVPINTYTALWGAGFNFLTQHMFQPIIAILVQPC
jgi:hypothetical protein